MTHIAGLEDPEAVGPGVIVLRVVPQRGRDKCELVGCSYPDLLDQCFLWYADLVIFWVLPRDFRGIAQFIIQDAGIIRSQRPEALPSPRHVPRYSGRHCAPLKQP